MFDDSTLGDAAANTNQFSHEHSRTRVVSKRSVSEPSDNNSEVSLWQRIKRSVASFFGFGDDDEMKPQPEKIVEAPQIAELKAAVPAQQHLHEIHDVLPAKGESTQRRRRDWVDDDDEDEFDEGDGIEGSSGNGAFKDEDEHESTSDNEVNIPPKLPDIPDGKYCK